jgi:uncharacterized protein YjiS (DUF1127 family)
MAYANTNHAARSGLMGRLALVRDGISTAVQQRRIYGRTLAELNALTDRELNDLGISRMAIPDLAHEAAYGK